MLGGSRLSRTLQSEDHCRIYDSTQESSSSFPTRFCVRCSFVIASKRCGGQHLRRLVFLTRNRFRKTQSDDYPENSGSIQESLKSVVTGVLCTSLLVHMLIAVMLVSLKKHSRQSVAISSKPEISSPHIVRRHTLERKW